MSVTEVCRNAARAAQVVRELDTAAKDRALASIAEAIEAGRAELKRANELDVRAAAEAGTSPTLIDRLTLTDKRIDGMIGAVRTMIGLADPVGTVVGGQRRPQGLVIEHVREPLGVVSVIYEARPNVAVDVAAMGLKSGNAVVLRGSSVARNTNLAIFDRISAVLEADERVPADAVGMVRDFSREAALELMRAEEHVDLLIPRGGAELIRSVEDNATVPTVIDGAGNCHLYVDSSADPAMASEIAVNGKTSRPSVCNAVETMLVHEDLVEDWLPKALDELAGLGVEVRGCARTREAWSRAAVAEESDWASEYLDLVLAVRVVADADEAVEHINRWGTSNAEGIVAQDVGVARRFARAIDSGGVFVNASTRFSDGGEFGYGVEIGVSTQKLHARGPMGMESLTCVKNVVWGDGHVRVLP